MGVEATKDKVKPNLEMKEVAFLHETKLAEWVALHGNSIKVACKFDTKGSCTVKTLCCFEINR